jgi:hypothetical protein
MQYYLRVGFNRGRTNLKEPNIMKSNQLVIAVIPGVIVAAALVLSFRSPVSAESLVGFGAVFALIALLALEYRFNWKNLLGR